MTEEEIIAEIERADRLNKSQDYVKAQKTVEDILEEKVVKQAPIIHTKVLNTIVESLLRQGNFQMAGPYAELALKTAETFHTKEELAQLARVYHNLGVVCINFTDYQRALAYFGKSVEINEENGNQEGLVASLNNIGHVYQQLADYLRAIDYMTRGLAIFENIGDKKGIAMTLLNIGNVYGQLAEYPSALECYSKSLDINEQIKNERGIVMNLANIGNVYNNLADFPKALDYYTQAQEIYHKIGYKAGLAINFENIGSVHSKLASYHFALEYFTKALEINEQIENKIGIASNLGNLGVVYRSLEEFSKSLEYLQKALLSSEEIGAHYQRIHRLIELGNLYAESKFENYSPKIAEEYLHLALEDSIRLGVKNVSRDSCILLCRLYQSQKRWHEAYDMKCKQEEIEKEINAEEAKKLADKLTYQRQQNQREKEIAVEKATAQAKQEASDNLLNKVLPSQIATRMLEGETEIADYYPSVSILFADIQGFTPLTADMPAYLLVRLLNHIFSRFDEIMLRNGCTKIKTIGDGYMAVAGAPDEIADHAERIAGAALEMLTALEIPEEIIPYLPTSAELKIRVGLHTGPVVAGVVGQDRFMYDVYSDAVNTASRMESHGAADKVHVSSDFMRHLLNRFAMTKNTTHGYTFENRGDMDIKGKGIMKTFFLNKVR